MDPNQNFFSGNQTPNTPPVEPTQTPINNPAPQQPAEPTSPTQTVASLANTANKPKKSKAPIIIAIIAFLVIVAIAVVALILTSKPKTDTQKPAEEQTSEEGQEEPEQEAANIEFYNKDAMKRNSYTLSNIMEGFAINDYTYTSSPNISFHNAGEDLSDNENVFLILKVKQDNDSYHVAVATEAQKSLETINDECEKSKDCESDYISGATTIVTATKTKEKSLGGKNSTTFTLYSFTSSKKLLSYSYSLLGSSYDTKTETAIRSALVKAALTISDKGDKPYLFDMAATLPLPLGRHVKSYKDIAAISEHGPTIKVAIDDSRTLTVKVLYKFLAFADSDRKKTDVDGVETAKLGDDTYFIFGKGDDEMQVIFTLTQKGKSKQITKASEAIELYKQITQ